MKTEAFDLYLAQCVHRFVRSEPIPAWPAGLKVEPEQATTRITFHGIALLLIEAGSKLIDWPKELVEAIREQARLQSFWELSHKRMLADLIEALDLAGIDALVLKGSALAYSVYPEPALRRRGDSDLLIEATDRDMVRAVFRASGFSQWSDVRPLQECWQSSHVLGFDHTVDLHWRLSASPAVSALLESNLQRRRVVALPDLSANAKGIGPIDNLLLICINRAAHGRFGYQVGDAVLFENDRLIWALDIHLLVAKFSETDWEELSQSARASGSSDIVLAGLNLARRSLGTEIPSAALNALEQGSGDARLRHYLAYASGRERFMLDLLASPSLNEKIRLIALKLFPTKEQLLERYPDANHWPLAVLRVRRLVSGFGNFVKGRT
ncbi:MAG: nucleotidyltransferase family protein [Erythrobacter sp.]|nr:nucleotidyltransferase family protein [Erythrobacter sp.]